jgi:hypothetical protein
VPCYVNAETDSSTVVGNCAACKCRYWIMIQPYVRAMYEAGRHAAFLKEAVPLHAVEEQGERNFSFYSFMTSAVDVVSGQHNGPATLYLRGKDPRYPLDRRLGGPQNRSGHRLVKKYFVCRGPKLDRPVVQSVVRHYNY